MNESPRAHNNTMNQRYQIGEFARHAGVTVRTLHHYDRLGLLRPVTHRDNGYRLYGESELARLTQIVTLRTLGFDLAAIKAILDAPDFDLRTALRAQIQLLEGVAICSMWRSTRCATWSNRHVLKRRGGYAGSRN